MSRIWPQWGRMVDTQVLAAFYFGGCLHLVRHSSKSAHLCLEAALQLASCRSVMKYMTNLRKVPI